MVTVFRIGHRITRDKRITTHLALVSRALGANRIVIAGEKDEKIIESVNQVVSEWGGDFGAEFISYEDWKPFLDNWLHKNGLIVHLTMYGENLTSFQNRDEFVFLKSSITLLSRLLIIVGGEKVPGKVFKISHWNIAITNQPHSEVASLAIFLDHLIPNSLDLDFPNSMRQIHPSINGKKRYLGDENKNE